MPEQSHTPLRPPVAILSIGSEVVDGRIVNTNAAWLAQQLLSAGFLPSLITSCRDIPEEILDTLTFLSQHAPFIITSGGLGPTTDDLTRQSIASFVGRELILSEEELGRLKSRFRKRGRKFDHANSIQVHFPEGSTVIPNPSGTAPGFITELKDGTLLYSLPGVPRELREMTTATVLPHLLHQSLGQLLVPRSKVFHLFGIPESEAGKKISHLELPQTITVGYRPHFPELEVRLETTESIDSDPLPDARTKLRSQLQQFIFSENRESSIPLVVHHLLLDQEKTIAVAESCTGGLLGKLLTNEPGSSKHFQGGFLTYTNALKRSLLGVREETLAQYGAVSPQTAQEMAVGARNKISCDIALSITGIAGPDGGTEEKPVGLFYVGLASEGYTTTLKFIIPSTREYIRRYAAYAALDSVRRFLLGLPYLGKAASPKLPF
ncbi:competence/damage-inducible protein A [bacterium]|nr:competence/damage-inducible protein A [bacterium]